MHTRDLRCRRRQAAGGAKWIDKETASTERSSLFWVSYDQRICDSRAYMSDLSDLFNSWLLNQNNRKIDAELPAAREEQNWYSELSVHSNPDVWSLIYNFSLQSSNRLMTDPPHFFFHSIVFDPKQKTTQDLLEVSKKFKKKMVTSYLSHLSYFERLADEQTNN